ncbi:stage II sporulation protein M [Flavobacterium sp. MFBS3-15]|uniref:stage II sporulation protein M n=1 Tax=Flavobacterium sp. MFBS3-15 TaxID=2989816 RepID=UPI00223633E2|nr:stage II sporulation protein M [Flavobacterium sp. MFBS3-15]MCW4468382.1 stage II sporulation protein M [Flavobacterium sp. MFBS3-15]
MREVAFIKQNKEKWLEFEQAIFGKSKKNPDDLASLYIHLVNDLAYARTYYPKSKTVVYLNHLASITYQKIYKTKREETNRLVYFFTTEVPLIVYRNRRYVLYAFLLFIAFTAIGAISAAHDDSFARLIMGDDYVNRTIQNIENGDPVAVYKGGGNWGMAFGITFNNLKVGLILFITGITGGIGTALFLFQNSVMLGSFQYFFYERGVFWASVRGIWIHGSMEIFAMVIEAAAGLILGAGILFPKTRSRIESLKLSFRDSLKIVVSTMPFTIGAGLLEGFVTRYSKEMPMVLNIAIILITLIAISYYYLVYPYKVNRKINSLQPAPHEEA